MQLDDGFYVWDIGVLPRGWSYRESGASVGGPIEDMPELEKQRHLRWDSATELAHWFGDGPLPEGWRRASDLEVEQFILEPEVQGAIEACFR